MGNISLFTGGLEALHIVFMKSYQRAVQTVCEVPPRVLGPYLVLTDKENKDEVCLFSEVKLSNWTRYLRDFPNIVTDFYFFFTVS